MTQQADLRSSVDGAGVWSANIVMIDEQPSEIRVLESWMATVLRQRDGNARWECRAAYQGLHEPNP